MKNDNETCFQIIKEKCPCDVMSIQPLIIGQSLVKKTENDILIFSLILIKVDLTIVERHEIAGQASGKAGGFLALDWNDRGPVGALARRSFELHDQVKPE